MKNSRIAVAGTPKEIARCFPVMRELRTHIVDEKEFVERVQRQQKQGYQLAFLESEGEIRAGSRSMRRGRRSGGTLQRRTELSIAVAKAAC